MGTEFAMVKRYRCDVVNYSQLHCIEVELRKWLVVKWEICVLGY